MKVNGNGFRKNKLEIYCFNEKENKKNIYWKMMKELFCLQAGVREIYLRGGGDMEESKEKSK